MDEQYNPQIVEQNVQAFWEEHNSFVATEDSNREKFYCLSMFPYPSGYLHMGHVRNYTIGDVIARYQRMLGKNVLQPMGWDAFGLPAENAAIKNNIPPAEWTYKNIDYMRSQFKSLGFSFDWSREITTCDPNYYRWEQWFFLRLFKKGLVYKKSTEVNWDPVDQTVLANEQVINGRGWRSDALVERRKIPQWFFKITHYADELLAGLDKLPNWPEQVKTMQRNWIGRSEGVDIFFTIENKDEVLTTFTTRADTLFGVTYIAIAPQHPLAQTAAEKNPAIQKFLDACKNVKVSEAELATLEKEGIQTPFYAIHPLSGERIPIWIANFVVMEYGTGALMAVPAHDERDFEFAKKYQLPIKPVIIPMNESTWNFDKSAFVDEGILVESGQFNSLNSHQAKQEICNKLEKENKGVRKINYRLRDWSISRQRYWGTPIPMINCHQCGPVPVPEQDLPVILPEKVEFSGIQSPLKTLPSFYEAYCPQCGQKAMRETDTFDTFFESSWYYARFACKKLTTSMLDGRVNYWVPVDQYIGGIEHAVMHLLYARFIHKTMRDEGLVNSDEPFTRLLTQGMVLNNGIKMSKSKGNTVEPKPLIDQYGTDTARLFVIFASPPDQNLEWSDSGVEGSYRFLKKLWALAFLHESTIKEANKKYKLDNFDLDWEQVDPAQREFMRQIYQIVEQVQYDYERIQLNTVVSGSMKLFNLLSKIPTAEQAHQDISPFILQNGFGILLRLLAPITPHIAHQLWEDLHYTGQLLTAPWPKTISLKADQIEMVVQINGKLRSRIKVSSTADKKIIEETVLQDSKVANAVSGKKILKMVTVPNKLVNIVIE